MLHYRILSYILRHAYITYYTVCSILNHIIVYRRRAELPRAHRQVLPARHQLLLLLIGYYYYSNINYNIDMYADSYYHYLVYDIALYIVVLVILGNST